MSKKRSRDFDPHPGDPWHPDWGVEDEAAPELEGEADAGWWRRALRRDSSAPVPEVYAALEASDLDAIPEIAKGAPAPEPQEDPPAAEEAAPPDPMVAAVARAFEEEIPPIPPADEPAGEPAPVAGTVAVAEAAVDDTVIEIDLRDSAPAVEEAVEHEAGVLDAVTEPEALPQTDVELAPRPPPDAAPEPAVAPPESEEPSPESAAEQLEAKAAVAAARAREHTAELTLVHRLAVAEQTAHEESAMWNAVAAARDAAEAGSQSNPDVIRRAPLDDSWAEEALAMEESRLRFEAARRRTEEEVRVALGRAIGAESAAPVLDEAAIASRLSAIAAQLELEHQTEASRLQRAEELRLRTSLLMLDAEEPWQEAGWSRPGASFGSSAAILRPSGAVNLIPISTTSGAAVPESSQRRRWPWSRKAKTRTTPTAAQQSQSVAVIEEPAVSDRDEMGEEEGQFELPFDDEFTLDTPMDELPEEVDFAGAGREEDAAPALSGAPEGNALDSTAQDELAAADEADWEVFTAEEYVQTATQDYADLAAAVAAAETEAPAPAALSADMPGLESGLVGLEDVVVAEGLEAAEAAPRSDLALRVGTALALVALFFASLIYQWGIATLVLVVMVMAAGELAAVLRRAGYQPVPAFAYLATLGLLVGTWVYGLVAIPFAVAAALLVILLYFGLVSGSDDPLSGMTLTLLAILWVGVLASFAMDLIEAAEYRWLVASLVVVVAVMDIAQYFVGKRFGKRQLAPVVSPKKTVAGLVGGIVAAVATGFGLSFVAPFEASTGLVLGAALAVTGPIGDLAVSVLKRTLGAKDMGTILPGHGGILDRIDAILFSLPAAWLVYAWAGLLV